jgi:hypothetical protein
VIFGSPRLVGILTGWWDAESGPTMSGERVLDTGVRGKDCRGTSKKLRKHAKNTMSDPMQWAGGATSDRHMNVHPSYNLDQ